MTVTWGLDAARARGRKGGRKPDLNEDQIKQIKAMLKNPDIKVVDIARQYGVCRATIFNAVGPVKPDRALSEMRADAEKAPATEN
jgi:DNA invertase Pin-like site-specific DNA recombinase